MEKAPGGNMACGLPQAGRKYSADNQILSDASNAFGAVHSARKAIMGSTFAARRAGNQQAMNATQLSKPVTTA